VCDLRTGRTRAVSPPREFAPLEPAISADGRVVAVHVRGGTRSQVLVRALRRPGPASVVSRASGAGGRRLLRAPERRGTYQLVCAIHAPGMRTTVVVE